MTERKTKTEPTKSAFDFVDLITGRIGKITGLVVAIGGLAVAALTQWESVIDKLVELGWYTRTECLQVDPPIFPATVVYSAWDNVMKMELKGRATCSNPPGLYVTFIPTRVKTESPLRLRVLHEELTECKGVLASFQEPRCWDPKIPVASGKGPWNWVVHLPPLERVNDPPSVEQIWIEWAVYKSDAPNKPILSDKAQVEVRSPARDAS